MSLKALSDYTFYSRYAQYLPENKRRETWDEAVTRVFDMHRKKYKKPLLENPELQQYMEFAETQVKKKRALAAQRTLQFAIDPILKHELKTYNCTATHIDREEVFSETMYVLLCGAGAGFSVQKHHIKKLGTIKPRNTDEAEVHHIIEDSIEGWADAIAALMDSYFSNPVKFPEYNGKKIHFDFSNIRLEGALIGGRFKAPGPEGLKNGLVKISNVIERRINSDEFHTDEFAGKLRPIDAYDCIMHISDCVLSGGVRRSATLCMFSHDDTEMMNAKIGAWFKDNPQRGRSNNSAVLLKGSTTREEFSNLINATKEYGEPGFVWVDDLEIVFNPCVEVGMVPRSPSGKSGWQGCNLTEINGKYCDTEEKFLEACRTSAIIGTLQAGYTNFKYLTSTTKEIFEHEALLGCSITGWMDNPDILFDEKIQRKGAKIILEVNEKIAKMIGINPAARATCVKPAGSTSCVLGTASGIHPHHAKRYIRRTQVNRTEFCGQFFQNANPHAVEKSVWSANGTDNVISFLCEVPPGAITKNQISAVDLLSKVKLTQQNWVKFGTRVERCTVPEVRHNVSNTCTVMEDEWDDVEKFIFDNQKWFAGVSLLPASGDLDYVQAPFSTVLTPNELVKEYGDASVFASGLVVDGLHAFDNNLWKACDTVLGRGEDIETVKESPKYPTKETNKALAQYFTSKADYDEWFAKIDWIRRAKQFADRYFEGDVRRMTYCLKHVSLWKTWCDLKREYNDVDWSDVVELDQTYVDADTLASQACTGTKGCDI